jgi:uncharacterized protein (DUF1810 family)
MTEDSLQRFVDAQEPTYRGALAELRAGRKQSHWMWFIFPQIRGLGRSETARFFGIASLDEARRYASHPVLGPRLIEATEAVLQVRAASLHDIFGSPDDLKFCSSMTLFSHADPDTAVFQQALDRWCGGREDENTLALIR